MAGQWVVLLEAAREGAPGPIGAVDVGALLEVLDPGGDGGALHCRDRYALQVMAAGASPADALSDVVARWTDAVVHRSLSAWKLVRVEVFTPAELDREFAMADYGQIGFHAPQAGPGPEQHDEISHELPDRAFSDALTGLLGRQLFIHQLETALAGTCGRGPVAVVCIDVDGFQRVNDLFGEATGNEALTALARRLAATLRSRDLLARVGGDEYGVLLKDSTEDVALAVAERMLEAVRLPMTFSPLTFSGKDLTLSASAGVAVSRLGQPAEVVIANAGAALSAAKAMGGNRPLLHEPDVSHVPRMAQDFATDTVPEGSVHLQFMQQTAAATNETDIL